MGLSVSISYLTSFPSIPGDRAPDLATGSETEAGITIFKSVYEYLNFGINLEFSYQTDDESPLPVAIESITATVPNGIKYTTSGSSVNLNGSLSGIFNEQWDFVMRDKSIRRLPINNTEDWVAVVKWHPASFSEKLLNYNFTVKLETSETVTMSIPQYAYWKWQTSLAKLKDFVKEGEI